MEYRRLRYFIRIALEGSLGKASQSLGIAQPALSRQMQLLEAELGVKLFQRMPRGMRLTEEGEYLREALDHPLKQIDNALRSVRSYSARIETSLNLGLPPPLARLLGPRLFVRLGNEVPNLRLRIVEDHSARLAEDLRRGLLDIAILVGVTPDDRMFHSEVLREELMLVGRANSMLASRDIVPVTDLERFPLILPSMPNGLLTRLEKLVAGRDAKINVLNEVDSMEVAKEIVKLGSAYAILPPVAFRDELLRGEFCCTMLEPGFDQIAHYAVQLHWQVRRSTYNAVERVIFGEWSGAVERGEWPATWLFDHRRLSTYANPA